MRIRVKICGVTTPADARLAADLGTDAVGLNFYPRSPRCITEDTARAIIAALPPFVEPVLLSVNETWDQIATRLDRLPGASTVQIHGDQLTPCPVGFPGRWLPAFPVRSAESLAAIEDFLRACRAGGGPMPAGIVVDAHVAGSYGGTGQLAPWPLLANFKPGVPLILAGGLTPDNVGAAIQAVRPFAVDVAGGVEASPGLKDAEKMRRFLNAAG